MAVSMEKELIMMVEKYAYLYNNKLQEFKDNKLKENTWEEIGRALSIPAEACCQQWAKFRQRYSRELTNMKRNNSKCGTGIKKSKPWKYMECMAFVKPYIIPRNNLTTTSQEPQYQDDAFTSCGQETDRDFQLPVEEFKEMEGAECMLDSVHSEENFMDSVTFSPVESQEAASIEDLRKCPCHASASADEELVSVIQKAVSALEKCKGNSVDIDYSDSDTLYVLSLVGRLKKLSREKNSLARIHIERVFYNLEFSENSSNSKLDT